MARSALAVRQLELPDAWKPDGRAEGRAARIRRVSDAVRGIRRRRAGKRFVYLDPDGHTIGDRSALARIARLAIPPAWTDVWICPDPAGHIQATGRDARGRKQYRYHPDWRADREREKYDRLLDFARLLPRIRRRVKRDLRLPGMPREKVLAAVVSLLDATQIRIGNPEYTRQNGSHGLTTLRSRHVTISGSEVRFRFRGKSGKQRDVALREPRLAAIVRACRRLRGRALFQYRAEGGRARAVSSAEVNAYLREIAGGEVTAKTFRTWSATALACTLLGRLPDCASAREARRRVTRVVAEVAKRLGNTPAVCRTSYIHPRVIDHYVAAHGASGGTNPLRGLCVAEAIARCARSASPPARSSSANRGAEGGASRRRASRSSVGRHRHAAGSGAAR